MRSSTSRSARKKIDNQFMLALQIYVACVSFFNFLYCPRPVTWNSRIDKDPFN